MGTLKILRQQLKGLLIVKTVKAITKDQFKFIRVLCMKHKIQKINTTEQNTGSILDRPP